MSTSVSVTGNLTRDPETRFTPGGNAVTNFGIAVNRGKDKPGEFFDVTAWDDLGENVAASLAKGDRVMVIGRLQQRSWETNEGDKRSKVEIVAYEVGPSLRWATIDNIEKQTNGDSDGGRPAGRSGRGQSGGGYQYSPDEEPF